MSLSRSMLATVGTLAILAFVAEFAGAQQQAQQASRGSIVGTVTEAITGSPLEGVQVKLAGTASGAMTSAEGRFTIANVSPGIYNVETMRVGYQPGRVENVEVLAGGQKTVNFTLTANALRLQTVVTTGVSDPTAGVKVPFVVTVLKPEDMPVPAIGSTVALIKGKISGVTVRTGMGPGLGTQIQLRNPMSIRTDTRPMFIVDGVIMVDFDEDRATSGQQADANNDNTSRGLTPDMEIDPSEIASIEVIKGAAAAALYGSKAANGVISITTNRGASIPQGTARYTFRSETGVSQLGHRTPTSLKHQFLVNEQGEYINLQGEVVPRASRIADPNGYFDNVYGGKLYDHTAQVFTLGQTYNNQITIGQSTLATNFLATVAANSETGVVRDQEGVNRKTMRLNIDHRAGDKFSVSMGASYQRTYTDRISRSEDSMFSDFLEIDPDVDILARKPDGSYIVNPDPLSSLINPLYYESIRENNENRAGIQTNLNANYRVTSFLTLSGTLGYQRVDRLINTSIPAGVVTTGSTLSFGRLTRTADFTEALNGNLAAAVVTQWGDFNNRARFQVAGELSEGSDFSIVADTANVNEAGAVDLDYLKYTRCEDPDDDDDPCDDRFESKNKSFLVSNALEYRGRYVIEGLYRIDGSGAYGTENPYQGNSRISAAWRMAEEPWWPLQSITEAKLRYSIGSASNNPQYDDRFQLFTFGSDGRIQKGGAGNIDLVPETVVEQEFGLDMQFMDRFGMELTYARQKSDDILRENGVLAYSGFAEQVQNVGTIIGQTFELTLEAHWVSGRNFRWNSTLVADRSRAKITRYERSSPCPDGFIQWCEGTVFGEINSRSFLNSFEELPAVHRNPASRAMFDINDDGLLVAVGPNGSWRDQGWGRTLVIDGLTYRWGMPIWQRGDDLVNRRVRTQLLPVANLGLSNNFTYKRLNAYVLVTGQVGGLVYNGTRHTFTESLVAAHVDQTGKPDYRKKPTSYYNGDVSGTGQTLGIAGETNYVDYFYEPATYAKFDELMLAYTMPGTVPFLSRIGLDRGRLALIGRNLYTITPYSGYDPEVAGATSRFDQLSYPRYRTFSAQLEFVF